MSVDLVGHFSDRLPVVSVRAEALALACAKLCGIVTRLGSRRRENLNDRLRLKRHPEGTVAFNI